MDYSDASVVIVPMEEYKKYGAEGFVDHEHVNPIYLEKLKEGGASHEAGSNR